MLIAAHGNSLRAMVKYLDNMTDDEIMALNIPTGESAPSPIIENLRSLEHSRTIVWCDRTKNLKICDQHIECKFKTTRCLAVLNKQSLSW